MIYEKIDLYKHFGIPRGKNAEGYLTAYIPGANTELKQKLRPAMIVLPGGGYGYRSPREGEPVAIRFMSDGYSAFVLDYSVNIPYPVPLIEACMAAVYVRENASRYCVDENLIAAIGFSAGGHLAGMFATMFADENVKNALGERAAQARPDAVILSYPVIDLSDERTTHCGTRQTICGGDASLYKKLSIENNVNENSVPAFIWHTYEDDCVPVQNSLMLASAYKSAGVPFSLHIFEKGWHGLSLISEETHDGLPRDYEIAYVGKWYGLACDWLQARGFKVKNK